LATRCHSHGGVSAMHAGSGTTDCLLHGGDH
jgi:hypothetical protein